MYKKSIALNVVLYLVDTSLEARGGGAGRRGLSDTGRSDPTALCGPHNQFCVHGRYSMVYLGMFQIFQSSGIYSKNIPSYPPTFHSLWTKMIFFKISRDVYSVHGISEWSAHAPWDPWLTCLVVGGGWRVEVWRVPWPALASSYQLGKGVAYRASLLFCMNLYLNFKLT